MEKTKVALLTTYSAILSLRNLKTQFDMKTQIKKLDRLMREIEMDEYLNEETLPKIREAKGFLNTLHEKCNIANVVNRRELLLDFADYSESDKTSQTTDECVDNYLDSIK